MARRWFLVVAFLLFLLLSATTTEASFPVGLIISTTPANNARSLASRIGGLLNSVGQSVASLVKSAPSNAKQAATRIRGTVQQKKSGSTTVNGKQTTGGGLTATSKTKSSTTVLSNNQQETVATLTASGSFIQFINWLVGWAWTILSAVVGYLLYVTWVTISNLSGSSEGWKEWLDEKRTQILIYKDESKFWFLNPLLWVLLGIGVVLMLFQGFIRVIRLFFSWFPALFTLLLLTGVFLFIQNYNTESLQVTNSIAIGVQKTTNTATGMINIGKRVMNVVTPVLNARMYGTVQSAKVMYNAFVPEDATLDGFSCSPPQSGRRLSAMVDEDGYTTVWDIKHHLAAVNQVVIPATLIMTAVDRFFNMLLQFQLMLVSAFIEPILFVLSLLMPKAICLMQGGIKCAIAEIFDILITVIIDRLVDVVRLITLGTINIPYPEIHIGCHEGQFPVPVDAGLCAGMIWDTEPPGAVFSELKKSTVNTDPSNDHSEQAAAIQEQYQRGFAGGGRRLQDQEQLTVHCERSKHDGSYLERLSSPLTNRILHRSHRNGCPHARDLVLHAPHERVLQFHRLDVTSDCIHVCIENIHLLSCFYSMDDHPIYPLGSCSSPLTEVNQTVIAVTLEYMFPTYNNKALNLTWQEPPFVETPFVEPIIDDPDPFGNTTETHQRRRLGRSQAKQKAWTKSAMIQQMDVPPKFMMGQVECDVSKLPQSVPEMFLDMTCLASRGGSKISYEQFGPDKHTVDSFFDRRDAQTNRRSLKTSSKETEAEMIRQQRIVTKMNVLSDEFVRYTAKVRKSLRLLRTAHSEKESSFTRRVLSLVSDDHGGDYIFNSVQQSLDALRDLVGAETESIKSNNTTKWDKVTSSRRRRLELDDENPPTLQILGGDCPADMYLCPNRYQCVLVDNMEDCAPPDQTEDTSILQTAAQALHNLATTKVDVKGYVSDQVQCWCDYERKPSTLPFTATNLRVGASGSATAIPSQAKYCLGMRAPYTSFSQPIPETGIRSYVAGLCNGTDVLTTNCYCPWYRPTILSADVYVSNVLQLWVVNHIINALFDLQTFVYLFLTGPHAIFFWLDSVWSNLFTLFCGGRCAPWLIHMFGDLGYDGMTSDRRLMCLGLHLGSLFFFILVILTVLAWVIFLWPAVKFLASFFTPVFDKHAQIMRREKGRKQRERLRRL